jgi:hypothetical protein
LKGNGIIAVECAAALACVCLANLCALWLMEHQILLGRNTWACGSVNNRGIREGNFPTSLN